MVNYYAACSGERLCARGIFENRAISSHQSAISQKGVRPSADCDWDWDWDWVWVWVCVALGWPKGHPSVAQGPRRGHASVDSRKCLCLQQKL